MGESRDVRYREFGLPHYTILPTGALSGARKAAFKIYEAFSEMIDILDSIMRLSISRFTAIE